MKTLSRTEALSAIATLTVQEEEFVCNLCQKSFPSRSSFCKHCKEVHLVILADLQAQQLPQPHSAANTDKLSTNLLQDSNNRINCISSKLEAHRQDVTSVNKCPQPVLKAETNMPKAHNTKRSPSNYRISESKAQKFHAVKSDDSDGDEDEEPKKPKVKPSGRPRGRGRPRKPDDGQVKKLSSPSYSVDKDEIIQETNSSVVSKCLDTSSTISNAEEPKNILKDPSRLCPFSISVRITKLSRKDLLKWSTRATNANKNNEKLIKDFLPSKTHREKRKNTDDLEIIASKKSQDVSRRWEDQVNSTPEKDLNFDVSPNKTSTKASSHSSISSVETESPVFFCPIKECKQTFSDPHRFNNHLEIHEGLKPFVCPYCSSGYATDIKLIEHVTLQHNFDPLFECENCREKYATERLLIAHSKKCR